MTMQLHDLSILETTERAPAKRSLVVPLVVLVVGGALLGAYATMPRGHEAERASIGRMAAPERHALFQATRQSAESVCAASEGEIALVDRCQGLAKFMQAFSSECDESCRAFGRTHRPTSIAR